MEEDFWYVTQKSHSKYYSYKDQEMNMNEWLENYGNKTHKFRIGEKKKVRWTFTFSFCPIFEFLPQKKTKERMHGNQNDSWK